MDINSPAVAEVAQKYGDSVRLVGTWDGDFRDLEYRGEQVYGWRSIPEDTPGISALLSWDGNGRGMWSPDVVTQSASVVYREELSDTYAELLKAAVTHVAKLKGDVRD